MIQGKCSGESCGRRSRGSACAQLFRMQVCLNIQEQVGRGGNERARANEDGEIPATLRMMPGVVSLNEARLLGWRKRDDGVVHSERAGDFSFDKLLVGNAGAKSKCVAEQAEAEIAV